jgi:hypothetical protein
MKTIKTVLLVIAAWQHVVAPASAETVYDSLTGQPFLGSLGCCAKTGQSVTLDGSQRRITEFEAALASAPRVSTFYVEFYQLDGPNGEPGSLIWQSPVQTYPYTEPNFNRKVILVDVPAVAVPSTFAYLLTTIERANNSLINTGPPTVGSVGTSWYYGPTGWVQGEWTFGARIHAVPEPAGLLLAASGCTILGFIRRRR